MNVEARIEELGITLPEAFAPAGNYLPCVVSGNLVYTAGQVPRRDGDFAYRGVVGDDLTVEDGQEAARLCCLGGLAAVRREIGSLDRILHLRSLPENVRGSRRHTLRVRAVVRLPRRGSRA